MMIVVMRSLINILNIDIRYIISPAFKAHYWDRMTCTLLHVDTVSVPNIKDKVPRWLLTLDRSIGLIVELIEEGLYSLFLAPPHWDDSVAWCSCVASLVLLF